MNVYIFFFACLIVFLLAIGIWQIVLLYGIKKKAKGNDGLSEKSYYELKYQLQMLTSIFPAIILLLGFFGFKELTAIPETVNKEIVSNIKPKIDSLNVAFDSLLNKQAETEIAYSALLANYGLLKSKEKGVRKGLETSTLSLQELQNQLNNINQKDIIQQNIYVVGNLTFKYLKNTEPEMYEYPQYKFADLETVSGQRLSKFRKPPIILQFNNTGDTYSICDVTTTGFKAWNAGGTSSPECEKNQINKDIYQFSVIIFSQD